MAHEHCFVVVQQGGDWTLLERGNAMPLLVAVSRAEVVTIGKLLAEQFSGQLIVHDAEGAVEAEHTYRA